MTDMSIYIEACDFIARHCIKIGGEAHGSAWLFGHVARFFDNPGNAPVEALTLSVFLNVPLFCEGEATIHRDGTYQLRRRVE